MATNPASLANGAPNASPSPEFQARSSRSMSSCAIATTSDCARTGSEFMTNIFLPSWLDRSQAMRGAVAIVDRLRAEGRLDLSWAPDEAAKLIWELTSFRVWD